MSIEKIAALGLSGFAAIVIGILIYWRLPKRLKATKFEKKWKQLQLFCRDKTTWRDAIVAADRLLDEALKKRKYSGGSMGERLVSAHKIFTDHDSVWQAHNLYKKLDGNPSLKPRESDVKNALLAFRQALRDLGALKSSENGKS